MGWVLEEAVYACVGDFWSVILAKKVYPTEMKTASVTQSRVNYSIHLGILISSDPNDGMCESVLMLSFSG